MKKRKDDDKFEDCPYTKKIEEAMLADELDDEISFEDEDDVKPTTSCVAACVYPFMPCTFCCHFHCLDEGYEHVKLVFGKYNGTVKEAGCYYSNCCGLETKLVTKKINCIDLPNTKVVDSRGNPLNVSAIVAYKIVNSRKAVLEVENAYSYIVSQATMTLKSTVSQYPYELMEGDSPETLCLRRKAKQIERVMCKKLQENLKNAGVKVISMQFNELAYAPEVANGMLKKQGALVTMSAKQKIAQGAVDIAFGAVDRLAEKGIVFSTEEKSMLVSNLLLVICSENDTD